MARAGAWLLVAPLVAACAPNVVVGALACAASPDDAALDASDAGAGESVAPADANAVGASVDASAVGAATDARAVDGAAADGGEGIDAAPADASAVDAVDGASVIDAADGALGLGAADGALAAAADASAVDAADGAPELPANVPWSTGFEEGFCDYQQPQGFCLATGSGSIVLVTAPVHSGRYAARFFAGGDANAPGAQARCVRQGIFPAAAYYGAWYYVPEPVPNAGNWNLFHFQGGTPEAAHGLWDVSVGSLSDGGPTLQVYDFLNGSTMSAGSSLPIARWFHIEVYFRRAKDSTGALTVWQDGVKMVDLTGLATDDTTWGQWFIGDLVIAQFGPPTTVYVDDVVIGNQP